MSTLLEEAILLHKKGELKAAENLYKSILRESKNNFEVTHLLGIIKIQLKQFEEATVWLSKAITINPKNHSTFNNLGVCYKELKKYPEALNSFNSAIKIKPDYAEVYNNIGIVYKSIKNFTEAVLNYKKAIKLKPDYAEVYNNLGIIYLDKEEYDEAKSLFEKAIKLKPDYTEAYNNLGIIYLDKEEYDAAKILFEKAIKLKPNYAEAINNLGNLHLVEEKYDEAKSLFEKAIQLKPDYAKAICNLGLVFIRLKDFKKAKLNIDKSIKLKEKIQNNYIALGTYYHAIEDLENAEINFKKAIGIKGKEVSHVLAILYFETNRLEESLDIINKLIELKPKNSRNYFYRSAIYSSKEEHLLSLKDLEKAFRLNDNLYKSHDKTLMLICAQNKFCQWSGNKKLKNLLNNISKEHKLKNLDTFNIFTLFDDMKLNKNIIIDKIKELSFGIKKTVFSINKNKKIRVGYYSPDFKEHPVGYIVSELFSHHNKDKFEIIGFSLNPFLDAQSKIKNEIIKELDDFIECGNDNYLKIAEKSVNHKIDIAIDLAGFTGRHKLKSFIKGVAPIQINFLGYPGTLGTCHDYIVADLEIIPEEKQHFYSEKIIYMPPTFLPSFTKFETSINFSKEKFNLEEKKFIFANFNSQHKITPDIFSCWMRILKKVKNSILWLDEGTLYSRENLKNEATKRGIDAKRIIFSKKMDYYNHTAKYKFCDLFLDTYPYTAHSTASSCLLSGCPLITIKGESFHASVSSSILSSLNLNELVCKNIEEYENKIIYIANTQGEINKIKKKLNNSLKNSKTFDTKKYVENLEEAYTIIYERYNKNIKPENIFIK